MIQSGRGIKNQQKTKTDTKYAPISENKRAAGLTAILGSLVFTVFLCLSAGTGSAAERTGTSFGDGAYQVFAPASEEAGNQENPSETESPRDAMAEKDDSIWYYLESVIARLIYGDR